MDPGIVLVENFGWLVAVLGLKISAGWLPSWA